MSILLTSSWVSLFSSRHSFNRSPIVLGSGNTSRGIWHFLDIFAKAGKPNPNCKRATLLCRCGAPQGRTCGKAPKCMASYQGRISGPMLDRIDLQIDLPAVTVSDLSNAPTQESSAKVAERVLMARQMQAERYKNDELNPPLNVVIGVSALEKYVVPDATGQALLSKAADAMRLSARAYHRTLKVARTIADLDGDTAVKRIHIAEALAYRRNDPMDYGAINTGFADQSLSIK